MTIERDGKDIRGISPTELDANYRRVHVVVLQRLGLLLRANAVKCHCQAIAAWRETHTGPHPWSAFFCDAHKPEGVKLAAINIQVREMLAALEAM